MASLRTAAIGHLVSSHYFLGVLLTAMLVKLSITFWFIAQLMALMDVDISSLQVDSRPKSVSLLWGSAAAWGCST